jgi:hypothetical protein
MKLNYIHNTFTQTNRHTDTQTHMYTHTHLQLPLKTIFHRHHLEQSIEIIHPKKSGGFQNGFAANSSAIIRHHKPRTPTPPKPQTTNLLPVEGRRSTRELKRKMNVKYSDSHLEGGQEGVLLQAVA